jgi:hypothetical protein
LQRERIAEERDAVAFNPANPRFQARRAPRAKLV